MYSALIAALTAINLQPYLKLMAMDSVCAVLGHTILFNYDNDRALIRR